MAAWTIGLLVFIMMMVMVFMGIPVFVSMLTSTFVGFVVLYGGDVRMLITQFTNAPFSLGANYNYAVLPMFMLVGSLAGVTGVAEGAFSSMRAWFGRARGSLLYAVIGANAVFGACSGSSIAGNIVFGKLAMPELEKAGYNRKYAMGCITAAGALSTLIPPSMGIIMFCLIAPGSLSVGSALAGGIIPGIITALALCLTVRIIGAVKPGSIPPGGGEKTPSSEKIKSLRLLIPILALFTLIIGGTFAGWFTATVGGAVGAVAVCIYAFVKKIPMKTICHSLWESAVMEAGIFPIIVGGQLFGRFIADTQLADYLSMAIARVNAPPFVIFMLVIALYIFCGCVMDIISIIIITTPVVFPILTGLGYSPYALIIALCFMSEIAGLTPPIGMNVFATANALRVNASEIFKGVLPYFVCELLVVVLIGLFPQIVTFLPKLMGAPGL
ncbi:MAG: TRAP transporter large permease subunit [Lachnospiraceae bacterium]|jgi:tripartite ATP-independent transporter DctM subunit|nr:TRAP transporter large permease subunit [Lachnospiraceae bacterium]